ncbi:MAG: SUF system Fe-S cluster assembly protein [candidate division KSB1 bacterium]|nr:SUF system Fe-S cluster assembly protein [candidate division KSB1 bacterium]
MEPSFSVDDLREEVIETLRTCYDPEIPVNIYDLGLVYEVDVDQQGRVKVVMTLTSPACPVAETLPDEVHRRIQEIDEVTEVDVEVVWEPPWNPSMMSEAARLELNYFT